MNDIKSVHPVHVAFKHEYMVPTLLRTWGDSKVVCLGRYDHGTKPDNITLVNMESILELPDYDTRIPYGDEHFDNCLCVGVLEHTREPHVFTNEIYRILSPGGQVYIEVPFLEPFDPSHPDYFRFTPAGLKYLFREFTIEEFGIANGPGSTMHWISRIYESLKFDRLGIIDDLTTKLGYNNYTEAYNIFGVAYEYMKAMDEELSPKEHAALIACSYYMLAAKPSDKSDDDESDDE